VLFGFSLTASSPDSTRLKRLPPACSLAFHFPSLLSFFCAFQGDEFIFLIAEYNLPDEHSSYSVILLPRQADALVKIHQPLVQFSRNIEITVYHSQIWISFIKY